MCQVLIIKRKTLTLDTIVQTSLVPREKKINVNISWFWDFRRNFYTQPQFTDEETEHNYTDKNYTNSGSYFQV